MTISLVDPLSRKILIASRVEELRNARRGTRVIAAHPRRDRRASRRQSQAANTLRKCAAFRAPTTVSRGRPASKRMTVEIEDVVPRGRHRVVVDVDRDNLEPCR